MGTQNLEVTNENVLNALIEMPQKDFEEIVRKAARRRKNGKSEKPVSAEEADLLYKINNIFPTAKRRRYDELYRQFKNDDLTIDEHEELTELVNEFELLNVKRIEYIGELASLRGQTLEQVLGTFEITNSGRK